MAFPKDVRVIDCMMNIPSDEHNEAAYKSMSLMQRDPPGVSTVMPAGYMFKNVPSIGSDPAKFVEPLPGTADETVLFTVVGLRESVDGIHGMALEGGGHHRDIPYLDSSRYARIGDLLELTVRNGTQQHHPLHLHGFSFQPVRLLDSTGKLVYEYDYNEFMDTIDIPATHQLVFRVRLHDRPVAATGAPGGAAGRWMLHCHIFNHAELGMMTELVVLPKAGPAETPKAGP